MNMLQEQVQPTDRLKLTTLCIPSGNNFDPIDNQKKLSEVQSQDAAEQLPRAMLTGSHTCARNRVSELKSQDAVSRC